MSSLTTYATIVGESVQIVTPEPLAGSAGQALNDNFKALSDGVLSILNPQTANYVLAGPASGSAASPTFRALALSDIPSGLLKASNNLSDLANASTPRSNLGLGTAATQNTGAFDAAGSASTVQTNLNTHTAGTGSSVHGAVSTNTASQIVARDASGNFAAGTVTVAGLTVSGSGAVNVAGGTIVDGGNAVYSGGSLYAGQKASAPGSPTAGQLYFNTSSGTFQGYNGSAWAGLAGATGTSGAASLSTSYTTTGSWASTGLTVTLPNAGTYLVTMVVRIYDNVASSFTSLRLYNSTDSVVVSNSTIYGPLSSATGDFQSTTTASILVTTTGANRTIQLQAIQGSGSGVVVHTDSNGGTYLTYVQLA